MLERVIFNVIKLFLKKGLRVIDIHDIIFLVALYVNIV